jgi:hypothetical protein
MGELKQAGKAELKLHREKLKQARVRDKDSRKGLRKDDIVEEEEAAYLSALTGVDVSNLASRRVAIAKEQEGEAPPK